MELKSYFFLQLFILIFVKASIDKSNNVCTTWIDYFIIKHSKNCFYNPDVFSSTPEILRRHVGKYENHTVTTEDGYILHLFRVPKKNPKGVIILQPPITADSSTFVLQGNESIVPLFANLGYEVWLPNPRGTPFSQNHVNLSTNDPRYWDFSFHEMGIYDFSSTIKYIKNTTNRSDLIVLGHSMSATSALIYSSLKPEEAKNAIKVFILMAPAAYLRAIKSIPAKLAAPLADFLKFFFNYLGIHAVFTEKSIKLPNKIQVAFPIKFMEFLMDWLFGWNPEEYDPKLANLFLSNALRTTSLKVVHHYAQIVNNGGQFRMYDYGKKINMKKYNSSTPPEYPLKNIKVPTSLVLGMKDTLVTYQNSMYLFNKKLTKKAKIYGFFKAEGINHYDVQWGKDRFEKVYKPIIKFLDSIGFN